MGHLVLDEPHQAVGRLVDGQHQAAAERLREGEHALGDEARVEVRLLELRVGLVEDRGDGVVELVLQARRELLVGALQVGDEPRQVLLELRVVVDLEVRALVDPPGEVVVLDLVLPVVGDELRLRGRGRRQGEEKQGECEEAPQASPGVEAGVHPGFPI